MGYCPHEWENDLREGPDFHGPIPIRRCLRCGLEEDTDLLEAMAAKEARNATQEGQQP